MMYSKLVYPQAVTEYGRPKLPYSVLSPLGTVLNWDPYSPDPALRAEIWEDTQGTLTYDQAMELVHGLAGLKQMQKQKYTEVFNAATAKSVLCKLVPMPIELAAGQQLYAGLVHAELKAATSMVVRDFDNLDHTLPLADVRAMLVTMGDAWHALWRAKCAKHDKITQATTAAAVLAL